MKKILLLIFILLLSASLFGCMNGRNEAQVKEKMQQIDEKAVFEFG